MITDEFKAQVQAARDEGLNWAQVSKRVGRPKRTCQRALGVGQPGRKCAHKDCDQPALMSGTYCSEHARLRMRNKPGQGERQQQVMRIMRKLGHATSEELRQLSGLGSEHLGQVTGRLVRLGMLERPMQGHFSMPRPPEFRPEHPIPPTPDAIVRSGR